MNAFHHNSGGLGHTLAVSNAAVQFVAGNFSKPETPYVRAQVQGDDVYCTYDGTVPSSTNGEVIRADTASYFLLKDLLTMKFIRVNSDAKVFAQPCNYVAPSQIALL